MDNSRINQQIGIFLFLFCQIVCFPCLANDPTERIDYAALKSEVRTKYKLPPKTKDSSDEQDTRQVVGQLEERLKSRISFLSKKAESKEILMNRKMEITNLEYEIDHLRDCLPEIKAEKRKARKEALAKEMKEPAKPIQINPLSRRKRPYSY